MDNELQKIFSYLSSKHFHATRDWLEGCVSYFREQHQAANYSYSQMQAFVTQQWELADLREISAGCLPPNLSLQKKTVLSGKYSLQIESMCDIAKSCYSQIQTIRNVPLENVKATEQQKESWEPSAKRVLQLVLCDGVQEVKAIEYKPIRALDQQIVPGFKILIIGPVDCRRGVILLEQHNLQLIGGEVDSLLIPNALENVLARALNLDENPDPYNCQSDGQEQPSTTTRTEQLTESRQRTEDQFLDEDNDIFAREVDAQLKQLEEQRKDVKDYGHVKNIRDDAGNDAGNDAENDAENEMDMFEEAYQREIEMMDMCENDIETIEEQPLFTIASSSNAPRHQSTSSKGNYRSNKNKITMETELLNDDDIFLCISDADLELTPHENVRHTSSPSNDAFGSKELGVSPVLDEAAGDCNYLMQQEPFGIAAGVGNETDGLQAGHDSTLGRLSVKAAPGFKNSVKNSAQAKISSFFSRSETSTKRTSSEAPKIEFPISTRRDTLGEFTTRKASPFENTLLQKMSSNVDVDTCDISNQNIPSTSAIIESEKACVETNSNPFVYIQQINDAKITTSATYTVKAFVFTLTSFLKIKFNGWYLTARLCDGSAMLEVQFSSDLLDILIGFSVNEVRAMKKDANKNPFVNERLRKALEKAQQLLIDLNGLFTLDFDANNKLPCVTEVTELKEEHLKALEDRVRSARLLRTK